MARIEYERGSCSPGPAHPMTFFGPAASEGRQVRWIAALLVVLVTILAAVVSAQIADDSDAEVHIQPRRRVAEPVMPGIDPALKTHTKPLVKDVDVVLVPVTVADSMNRLVTGLEKENFALFEEGARQQIRHFSQEDAPISLGVIFDCSGSMADKIVKAREAVVDFFDTANPEDEFFLISFSDKPELVADFTQDLEDVQAKLIYTIPKGKTALLDALYLGLRKVREGKHEKRALLIISDGGDNHSRYTEREIKDLVRETDVQIYAIGLYDQAPRTVEEQLGPSLLSEVTNITGGHTFSVQDPRELPDVATKIGIELRNQYVLAYRPNNPVHDGKWRKIKVKLLPPKGLPPLHVYAKTGYYAPEP